MLEVYHINYWCRRTRRNRVECAGYNYARGPSSIQKTVSNHINTHSMILRRVISTAKRTQGYLRQTVQVTGLNLPLFETCIDNMQHHRQVLSRQVPEGDMEAFSPNTSLSYPSIEFGTRYFTSRRDDPLSAAMPFDHAIDPKGILTSMIANRYFHGEDNKVLYYRLVPSSGNGQQLRYVFIFIHNGRTIVIMMLTGSNRWILYVSGSAIS